MLSLIFLFILFLIIFYLFRGEKKGEKVIPGPFSIPLLGNVIQFIGTLPYKQFNKWTEKFGDIYQIRLGPKLNIVISDTNFLKEVFHDPNFTGRPFLDLLQIYKERIGIVINDGPFWETHRKFSLVQLKNLGAFARGGEMEESIISEVNSVISTFKETAGQSLDAAEMKKVLGKAVSNSFWAILCSGHDGSAKAIELLGNLIASLNGLVKGGMLALFCPWLRPICPNLIGYTPYKKAVDDMGDFLKAVVQERKKSFKDGIIRDFIDAYLAEIKGAKPDSPFYGELAEKQLIQSLIELYGGAGDAISVTLKWATLYLCKNPSAQQKFQREITSITGNKRNVNLSDKFRMPFTHALIDEVFRCASVAPNAFQHRALQDKTVRGYFIPKDAWVLPNLHFIHNNKNIWGDPEKFRPERFLDSDGNFKKNENVIPFGIGRRQCIGENLGRDALFLYLSNVYQKFTILFDPSMKEPGTEPKPSFVMEPQPFHVIMKERI